MISYFAYALKIHFSTEDALYDRYSDFHKKGLGCLLFIYSLHHSSDVPLFMDGIVSLANSAFNDAYHITLREYVRPELWQCAIHIINTIFSRNERYQKDRM